eukprot:5835451-Amphidinium_carterae.3
MLKAPSEPIQVIQELLARWKLFAHQLITERTLAWITKLGSRSLDGNSAGGAPEPAEGQHPWASCCALALADYDIVFAYTHQTTDYRLPSLVIAQSLMC